MPYDVLDAIERAAIRDKLIAASKSSSCMRAASRSTRRSSLAPGSSASSASGAATSGSASATRRRFHLDDENLDPKTWCRFPILSGGFDASSASYHNDARSRPSTYDYPRPALTVDCVVFGLDEET